MKTCKDCCAFLTGPTSWTQCGNKMKKSGVFRYLSLSHIMKKRPKWCPLKEARDE